MSTDSSPSDNVLAIDYGRDVCADAAAHVDAPQSLRERHVKIMPR